MLFPAWETFYVIVGSAAGALTGLMFVAVALIADARRAPSPHTGESMEAFGTPTVAHFGAVLLLSAIVAAPWTTILAFRVALGAFSAAGVVYMGIVIVRARRQRGYEPVLEDWIFHAALPLTVYGAILVAAALFSAHPTFHLFVVGGAALVLLFVALHNAWDTVTYVALTTREGREL